MRFAKCHFPQTILSPAPACHNAREGYAHSCGAGGGIMDGFGLTWFVIPPKILPRLRVVPTTCTLL